MPVAMVVGLVLHSLVGQLDFLTPYLIFAMLFFPFCGVRLSDLKITKLHIYLLVFQAVVSVGVYFALRPLDPVLAQGAMICTIAPTATSAVVVAAMLGARVSTMLSYSLLINVAVAVGAPLFFSAIAPDLSTISPDLSAVAPPDGGVSFWVSFVTILRRVIPILVLPFVASLLLRRFAPRLANGVQRYGRVSFWLWLVALTIVTGKVVGFISAQEGLTLGRGLMFAGVGLVACLVQFGVGRYIGRRTGDTVAGGQSLGQKNTILAIWLAQTYLNPLSSIAPASYVLWQNLVNTYQLWRRTHRK
ncbi:MAG: transporter [Rikenellaceae bacterium]|jgi:BASS family bile acid:Na+ symporter|nr:transporter [Rikenellaceae bacterium]